MDQAVLHYEAGQAAQDDYQLDLDHGVDQVEDLDFHLDTATGQSPFPLPGVVEDEQTGDAPLEFEISFDDDDDDDDSHEQGDDQHETHSGDEDYAQVEAASTVDVPAGVEDQDHDEIGYEDEELAAPNEDLGGDATLEFEPPVNVAEQDGEAHDEPLDLRTGMPEEDQAPASEHDHPMAEDPNQGIQHDLGVEKSGDEDTSGSNSHASGHVSSIRESLDTEAFPERDQENYPDSGLDGFDQVVAGLSDPSTGVSEISVFYNNVRYALFGAEADDPDSYFFDDVSELDKPLSEFLSSLRGVIEDDIESPHDEIVIRIDSLGLEFGEGSRDKFLRRTFREVLDCYNVLFTNQLVTAPNLDIELLVRLDCERQFATHLRNAGLVDYDSQDSDHSEAYTEDFDEQTSVEVEHVDEEYAASAAQNDEAGAERDDDGDIGVADGENTEEDAGRHITLEFPDTVAQNQDQVPGRNGRDEGESPRPDSHFDDGFGQDSPQVQHEFDNGEVEVVEASSAPGEADSTGLTDMAATAQAIGNRHESFELSHEAVQQEERAPLPDGSTGEVPDVQDPISNGKPPFSFFSPVLWNP